MYNNSDIRKLKDYMYMIWQKDPKLDTFAFYMTSIKSDVTLCILTGTNVFKIRCNIYLGRIYIKFLALVSLDGEIR